MIFRWEEFNEFVKNTNLISWYNKQILADVKKIYPEYKHSTDIHDESYLTTFLEIGETKIIKNIRNLLMAWQKKLLLYGIYLSLLSYEDYNTLYFFIKDLYVDRVKPPKYVYHVSDPEHRDSILRYGLLPRPGNKWHQSLNYPPAIFVSKNIDSLFFDDDMADIWKIDTENLKNKWWKDLNLTSKNKNHIMTYEAIPVDNISLYREGK